MVTPGQLSWARDEKFSTAHVSLNVAVRTFRFVQESVGGSVSLTVTVKLHCAPSEVLQLTVVVPTGNADPEGGDDATGTGCPQGSEAVAEKLMTAEHCPAVHDAEGHETHPDCGIARLGSPGAPVIPMIVEARAAGALDHFGKAEAIVDFYLTEVNRLACHIK